MGFSALDLYLVLLVTIQIVQGNVVSSSVEGVDTELAEAQGSAANDTAAALIASLLTSVIEAPVELFRHRMQVKTMIQMPARCI